MSTNLSSASNSNPQLSRWFRDGSGTFENKSNGGKPCRVKIANHSIWVREILYIVLENAVRLEYMLEFQTPQGVSVKARMPSEDLAEEKAFLRRVPPGFTLTSIPKAFSLLRECLMNDLPNARRIAVVTALGWYVWQTKPIFVDAKRMFYQAKEPDTADTSTAKKGTVDSLGLVDLDKVCAAVPLLAGGNGPVTEVRVEVPEQFSKYSFFESSCLKDVQKAFRAVFELMQSGDLKVTVPAIAALFVSVVREPRFAVFLYGESGSMKTAFALILQSFFAPDPKESDFASFKSTENALIARFTASGYVPVVVDDYVQSPGQSGGGEQAKKAENFIRSIVNGAGRDRCYGDGSLRPHNRPRGLAIITGEQLPDGLDSLKSRCLTIPVSKASFEKSTGPVRPNEFDRFQEMAADGTFCLAMGTFIKWIADDFAWCLDYLKPPGHEFSIPPGVHQRKIDATDNVLSGVVLLLDCALFCGAITKEEYESLCELYFDAVIELLNDEHVSSFDNRPSEEFGRHLRAALASHRCHIEVRNFDEVKNDNYYVAVEDGIPMDLLGYSAFSEPIPAQRESEDEEEDSSPNYRTRYKPHGRRIGWFHRDVIYLIPAAALREANEMASATNASQLPSCKMLGRELAKDLWIASQTKGRNTQKVRYGRLVLDAWCVHPLRLFEALVDLPSHEVSHYESMTEERRLYEFPKFREEFCRKISLDLQKIWSETLLNHIVTSEDLNSFHRSQVADLEKNMHYGEKRDWTPPTDESGSIPGYDTPHLGLEA